MRVEFTVDLPDAVAAKLREQHPDLDRLGLEKFVCSLYRDGRFSQTEAMSALKCSSRLAFEGMLTRHHLHREWSHEETANELNALDRLPSLG